MEKNYLIKIINKLIYSNNLVVLYILIIYNLQYYIEFYKIYIFIILITYV